MVARFVNGKSIRGVLHYNENKVERGEASLLLASGFAGDVRRFTLEQKLQRFEYLTMQNTRVKTNAIHISLNFDPKDHLSNDQLQQISMSYMERIGFGDQPYLVYRHTDAAHTHVHIATINVQQDGRRIDTHGIGWRLSEPARIAIEQEFNLSKAKGKATSNDLGIKAADIEKAVYGKSLTKRTITNIVNAVIRDYLFTSLAELNAALRQFNVAADAGAEQTLMREKGGLLYGLINKNGEQVGVPIKASAIYNKPTLKNLQKEFERNQEKRQACKEPLKKAIEQAFNGYSALSKDTFVATLHRQNINVLFRTNVQGFTYGVTFVDNRNKAVFNGSNLGKAYSAKALLERFSATDRGFRQEQTIQKNKPVPETSLRMCTNLKLHLGKYRAQPAPSVTRRKKRKDQDNELSI